MPYTIAIHPDRVRQKNGEMQSFSERWTELAKEAGIEVRRVDAFAPDFLDQLEGCDGFMWRFGFVPPERVLAKRLLPAIEHALGIPVFPSWKTAWHFEDKVAQHYLLEAAGIPMPRTWVFWKQATALEFCREATYPLVMKLSTGFQSANVRLLRSPKEAAYWIGQLFGTGVTSLAAPPASRAARALRRGREAARVLRGKSPRPLDRRSELQRGYFYVQEFLEGNDFDTRVTVVGDRAFGYRRMNRPNDFRASGSGRPDWDCSQIDPQFVRLAFRVARQLQTQSVAIDGMRRGEAHVLGEISYTYVSWMVRECPGHWVLRGDPDAGELEWVEGHLRPDDAIFQDFVAQLDARATTRDGPWPRVVAGARA